MGAARLCGKNDNVSLLPLVTVYRLAAPSVPPEIVETVTTKAASGEIVPDSTVKKMIEAARCKIREEQAKKRADGRSRLSKRRRQEEERRAAVRAEELRREEGLRREDLKQWVAALSIDSASDLYARLEEHGPYAVMEELKAKIEGAAR
jgi:hypothetical protein